jgi:hypothetical protein
MVRAGLKPAQTTNRLSSPDGGAGGSGLAVAEQRGSAFCVDTAISCPVPPVLVGAHRDAPVGGDGARGGCPNSSVPSPRSNPHGAPTRIGCVQSPLGFGGGRGACAGALSRGRITGTPFPKRDEPRCSWCPRGKPACAAAGRSRTAPARRRMGGRVLRAMPSFFVRARPCQSVSVRVSVEKGRGALRPPSGLVGE